MQLTNNVAIVTGAAGAIGRAVAARLAKEGATVAVADLNRAEAGRVAASLTEAGAAALALELDVCSRDSINAMVATVIEAYGRIDVLVNNAGGSARLVKGAYCLLHEAEERVIDSMIDINLKGLIFCTRAVLRHMVPRGQGRIVNMGSITGVQGSEMVADYSAAKGGVIAFTKALAKGYGPLGIRVNCVSPGLVPRPEEDPARALRSNFLHRVCTTEDVANLVAFLVSEDASFITGQNCVIDGGRSLALHGDP
ncbi:MAG: SDR family oxidoreductase [Lentisphaeria bacterium]|nr:SDR family oxidoreductase [Lentisphaeria bacterium]